MTWKRDQRFVFLSLLFSICYNIILKNWIIPLFIFQLKVKHYIIKGKSTQRNSREKVQKCTIQTTRLDSFPNEQQDMCIYVLHPTQHWKIFTLLFIDLLYFSNRLKNMSQKCLFLNPNLCSSFKQLQLCEVNGKFYKKLSWFYCPNQP